MAIAESASDTPTILGSFRRFRRRCFEIYPTGVGFLFDP